MTGLEFIQTASNVCQYRFVWVSKMFRRLQLCQWPMWAENVLCSLKNWDVEGVESHANEGGLIKCVPHHICSEGLIYVALIRRNNLLKGQEENVSPFSLPFLSPDIRFAFSQTMCWYHQVINIFCLHTTDCRTYRFICTLPRFFLESDT